MAAFLMSVCQAFSCARTRRACKGIGYTQKGTRLMVHYKISGTFSFKKKYSCTIMVLLEQNRISCTRSQATSINIALIWNIQITNIDFEDNKTNNARDKISCNKHDKVDKLLHLGFRKKMCMNGGGGLFLACEEFGRMLDDSSPACAFLLLSL